MLFNNQSTVMNSITFSLNRHKEKEDAKHESKLDPILRLPRTSYKNLN